MAHVKCPLFSFSASGSVGRLTFGPENGRPALLAVARKKPRASSTAPSPRQMLYRERLASASATWNALDEETRGLWVDVGSGGDRTPFTLFCREYILQRVTPPALPLVPDYIFV